MSTRKMLKEMVEARRGVIVPGAFNALSARVIEDLGFEAIYVTGAGVTNMWLAMPDQGFMGLHELADHTSRIRDAVNLPLIVDADTGFGNALNVYHTVRTLERAGADCIQFEDQVSPKRCGHFSGKDVIPIDEAVTKIKAAVDARRDQDLLIMARTDAAAVFGFEAAVERAQQFAEAGADLLFVEAVTSADEIRALPRRLPKPQLMNMVIGGIALSQNGYQYRALFSNSVGQATSNSVTLTVNAVGTTPVITQQPSNQAVTAGQTASFTALASSTTTWSVQWQISTNSGASFSDITGATATTFSIINTSTAQNGYKYRAVFNNATGTSISNAATLTVTGASSAPVITLQPASQAVTVGQSVSFSAAATGTPTPTVQWQLSTNSGATFANISGAAAATYSFVTNSAQNGYQYRAVFSNGVLPNATSSAATLTLNSGGVPSCTISPTTATIAYGGTQRFDGSCSNSPTGFQWKLNGNLYSLGGAGSTTYEIFSGLAVGTYTVAVSAMNLSGQGGPAAATLTVNPASTAPAVTQQPSNQSVLAGQSASFVAAASGSPAPSVQWQVSTDGGWTFTSIAGATSTTYSFSTLATQNGYQYRAVFTNSAGSIVTVGAILTVTPVSGTPAVMVTPTPGSNLSGTAATFNWTAGTSVSQYWLYVGTTPDLPPVVMPFGC